MIAAYYMIECSSTVLLTHAAERDASEVISEAWFLVLARYGPKGKRYDTIDITQNIAIRYDTMHKRNVKFNARASVRQ